MGPTFPGSPFFAGPDLVAGVVADAAGFQAAIAAVSILTAISGLIVWIRMPPHH